VKILELARDLIRLSGHRADEVPIAFSGLRSGEKLYEELLTDADKTLASPHLRLRIARLQDIGDRATLLGQLAATPAEGPLAARHWLQAAVADYRPAHAEAPARRSLPDRGGIARGRVDRRLALHRRRALPRGDGRRRGRSVRQAAGGGRCAPSSQPTGSGKRRSGRRHRA
jgi:hypothetical protein